VLKSICASRYDLTINPIGIATQSVLILDTDPLLKASTHTTVNDLDDATTKVTNTGSNKAGGSKKAKVRASKHVDSSSGEDSDGDGALDMGSDDDEDEEIGEEEQDAHDVWDKEVADGGYDGMDFDPVTATEEDLEPRRSTKLVSLTTSVSNGIQSHLRGWFRHNQERHQEEANMIDTHKELSSMWMPQLPHYSEKISRWMQYCRHNSITESSQRVAMKSTMMMPHDHCKLFMMKSILF
jgi:hypothetical protein